jgi:hypothetical protein
LDYVVLGLCWCLNTAMLDSRNQVEACQMFYVGMGYVGLHRVLLIMFKLVPENPEE